MLRVPAAHGHPADAGAAVVGLVLLDAAQAAQLLVARLSPLGNKQLVRVLLFHQPVVKILRDGLFSCSTEYIRI